jgi:hypothetical protein
METYNPQDLIKLPPSPGSDWVVEDLLQTQKRPSLFCGLAEVGKSTLAVQLAIAVAQGKPFLGRETQKSKVIIWKYESTAAENREDFLKAGMRPSDKLIVLVPAAGDDNLLQLEKALAEHPDTRLVIIETILDFLDIPDSNSTEAVKNAMRVFNDRITEKYPNCVFVLLHHFNKGELSRDSLSICKISGSHAFATTTATKVYINRVSDEDPRRYVHATVRKGRELEPTYLKFDPATNTSTLDVTVYFEKTMQRENDRQTKVEVIDQRILRAVRDNAGISKGSLAKMVGGKRETTWGRIDGLLERQLLVEQATKARGGTVLRIFPADRAPANRSALDAQSVLQMFDAAEDRVRYYDSLSAEQKAIIQQSRPDFFRQEVL